jgi:hypothetical protein
MTVWTIGESVDRRHPHPPRWWGSCATRLVPVAADGVDVDGHLAGTMRNEVRPEFTGVTDDVNAVAIVTDPGVTAEQIAVRDTVT